MKSSVTLLILLLLLISSSLAVAVDTVEIRGAVAGTINGISNLVDNTFAWNPENFAGFYLDLDRDVSTESLTLNMSNDKFEAGAVHYSTIPIENQFEHTGWGNYIVLGFLGQKYFAGYPNNCQIAVAWNSLENGGVLSRVLIDSDEKLTLSDDETLPLEEGYSLKLSNADNGAKISLLKGNKVVDSKIITLPADYIYTASIGKTNTTILAAGLKANVRLEPRSYYTIKGLFQVSENTTDVVQGAEYGIMRVDSIDGKGLGLRNSKEFNISQDQELMDGFYLKSVAPANALQNIRAYIYKNASKVDSSTIRGAIAGTVNGWSNLAADNSFTWIPQTFAGFYYDIKKDLGTENLKLAFTDVNRLTGDRVGDAPYGVTYTTTAQRKSFEFQDWGYYNMIGFLGKDCFVGYRNDSLLANTSKEASLLGASSLGLVLIDSKEQQKIQNRGTLPLKEGFEAKFFIDDSCNKTLIELYRNGTIVDRDYFNVPGTYSYKESLGGLAEITMLALHVSEINCTKERSCLVDGVFQISRDIIDVTPDSTFGKMNVRTVDAATGTIVMDNKDNAIILRRSIDVPLMGDFRIKTANSNTLRYYIYKQAEPT